MTVNRKITPIIHLIGPEGGGKTTLARLFLDTFTDKTILVVDASKDQYLTLSYAIEHPISLADLLSRLDQSAFTRESMDWVLQDLPLPVPAESDADILPLGVLPDTFSDRQSELLTYGLPRLFAHYDVIIWDGPIGFPESVLKISDIRHLVVITPRDESYCQDVLWENAWVLLSKAEATDNLPPTAVKRTQGGNWKFLGKLPAMASAQRRIQELPDYIQDCFQKLDLPFELRPRAL